MYREVFRNKNFVKLTAADVVSRFGDSVDAIAFTWLTYEISKSAAMSALVFAMNILPTAVFQPILGPVAERCKKKPVLIVTDLIRACMVAAVLLLFLTGALRPWMMLVFTFAMNTVEAMRVPCGSSFLVKVISREEYDRAISFSKTACMAAQLIGTAAGGVLAAWQIAGAFAVDLFTFLISAILISCIPVVERMEEKKDTILKKASEYMRQLADGIQYMAGSRQFLLLIFAAVLFNMENTFLNSLYAPYAAELFAGGGEVISILNFFLTAGMLVSMFCYPKLAEKISEKTQLILPFFVLAAFYVALLIIPALGAARYPLLALFSFINGLAVGLISNFFNIFFVKTVDQRYMARATGVFNSAVTLAMPLVSFGIAAAVKAVPLAVMFLIAAVLGFLCAAFFTFWKVTDALNDKKEYNDKTGDAAG